MGDPQESANERRHEQAEAVEDILESVDPALEEHAYPVSSEELSARYGSTNAELPNETESLGSVFDRLDDREFESPMAVKEEVLRAASDASPESPEAGDGRAPEADHGGTPQEVIDDLETEEVAEATRKEAPNDVGGAEDVGTPADTAAGPETDAAEPGDAMTPDTTEADEFAPQESVEDRDREGDLGEPTVESWEEDEELDPKDRGSEVPDAREGVDASDPSERARYAGDDEEPLEGTDPEELGEDPVPDARDEESEVSREGNVPEDEDGS